MSTQPALDPREDHLAILRRAFEDGAPLSPAEALMLRHANARCLRVLEDISARESVQP